MSFVSFSVLDIKHGYCTTVFSYLVRIQLLGILYIL